MSERKNIGGPTSSRRRTIWDCCALGIAIIFIISVAAAGVVWRTGNSIQTLAAKVR